MYLISACLVGINCKYNGDNNSHGDFKSLLKQKRAIPFCPEQAGGLPTPRPPAEIISGDGFDVIKKNLVYYIMICIYILHIIVLFKHINKLF
jgi:uncharacterized protein YbbK (DUF523 family)